MERRTPDIFTLVVSLLMLFFSAESYWSSRAERAKSRMDARRISDLTEISRKIGDFAGRHGRLPDQQSAGLCADFDRSTGISPQFAAGHFWSHRSGTECVTVSAANAKR